MAWKKYRFGTQFYDAMSGEWAVYRSGRVAGIELMGLRPGDTVVDLGCGTGLSFELLVDAVGPTGQVIGVDASAPMLQVAAKRAVRKGWSNVRVVQADATKLSAADLAVDGVVPTVDAVFSAYALSVMGSHPTVLAGAQKLLRSGGRLGIVDMQRPVGAAKIFTPLARLACRMGGADIEAHPWEWLTQRADDVRQTSRRGGHIRAVTGTLK
ncbi:class I SAM-dependent methyltransferase [Salinibacterium sp. SWN248]|uniref:class I SAM-dependent methyltransferase n=1 Tax=Salinibacterium sp. SWN248 TaxID=2792056 RepID=UPI0018CC8499|nr:methyltransferase domain-containing protein [Salinibacterium sp. SWN248]MBH0022875.1 methyltransferase domain-containing protein [Salinibacterium sp. SWN248]